MMVACARETWKPNAGVEFCRMLGQYDEYVLLVNAHDIVHTF